VYRPEIDGLSLGGGGGGGSFYLSETLIARRTMRMKWVLLTK
jgi:hypothetical protein